MTLEDLRIEKDRLYIRSQTFVPGIDAEIAFSAAEEVIELYDYCKAGYPALSSDWIISLWEIHPYQEPMS